MRRIAVIAFLFMLAGCGWLGLSFMREARARQAVVQLNIVCAAIEAFRVDVGTYPLESSNVVEVLRTAVPKLRQGDPGRVYLPADYSYPDSGGRVLDYTPTADNGYELSLHGDGSVLSILLQVPSVRCVTNPPDGDELHQAHCACTIK